MQTESQGHFKSNGKAKMLKIPSGATHLEVINQTQMATTQTSGRGVRFEWYKGLGDGQGFITKKTNSSNALNATFLTSGGFTVVDTSKPDVGMLNSTITALSTALIPIATNSGTNGLSAGDIVRIIDVASAKQFGGLDFTVGTNTLSGTTFSLDFAPQIATAGTSGSWRKVKYLEGFYPSFRYITKFTKGKESVLTFSVTHNYKVGQKLRIIIPAKYKMVEADKLMGTVTAVDSSKNSVTLGDVDSTSFTAFAFPATGDFPFVKAQVVPIGKGVGIDYNNLWGSTIENQGFLAIELSSGTDSPAGSNNDIIYWKASSIYE